MKLHVDALGFSADEWAVSPCGEAIELLDPRDLPLVHKLATATSLAPLL